VSLEPLNQGPIDPGWLGVIGVVMVCLFLMGLLAWSWALAPLAGLR
jgi:hypothetical protein